MKKTVLLFALLLPFIGLAQNNDVFVNQERALRGILLEELTGANCGYCPAAHKIEADLLALYPDQFFAVNIHAGGFATPSGSDPDMRTPDGNNLNNFYNPDGYPSGGLNRHKSGNSYTSNYTGWKTEVAKLVKDTAYVNIAARGELDWESRKLTLHVQEYFTGAPKEGAVAVYLHVAMIQDGIIAHQSDYNNYNPDQFISGDRYRHLHVLRDYLTDVNAGEPITDIAQGSLKEQTLEYTLPASITNIPLDLANTHFVVFVTENQKSEVANACQAEMTHINGPDHIARIGKVTAERSYNCNPSGFLNVELNNILGQDINSVTFEVTTEAGTGEYTLELETALTANKSQQIGFEVPVFQSNVEVETEVKLTKINGQAYTYEETKGSATIFHSRATAPAITEVILGICQDRYGKDITWTLSNSDKEVIYEGGPYDDLRGTGTKLHEIPMSLEQSCYALLIKDATKDGINNSYGNGYVSMKDNEGNEFYHHNGKYKEELFVLLDTRANASNQTAKAVHKARLAPNPAHEYAVLSLDMAKAAKARIEVLDKAGNRVLALNQKIAAGHNEIRLPVQQLSAGMYFVNVRGEGVNFTQKLVVIR